MYYEVWERFDEKATQYIALQQLCEFVDNLEEPLRIAAPNRYKLVTMNIPICADDRVHCVNERVHCVDDCVHCVNDRVHCVDCVHCVD